MATSARDDPFMDAVLDCQRSPSKRTPTLAERIADLRPVSTNLLDPEFKDQTTLQLAERQRLDTTTEEQRWQIQREFRARSLTDPPYL